MADANPSVAEQKPRLVSVPTEPAARPEKKQERRGVSSSLFWLVVVLLVLSAVGFAMQAQKAGELEGQVQALAGQVEGLQVQLSAANTHLQTYEMHRTLVSDLLEKVNDEMSQLTQLVNSDPLGPVRPAR